MNKTLLESIGDYRKLSLLGEDEFVELCADIRKLILDVTLKNGGHLGGSLGAVELCVSLLSVFNPERDKIIFDVGHQAYAYKILTERLERFHTLRRKGGISGFPRRQESRYDAFDVGHSSTSISAALGFAKARDMRGQGHEVVAVIGDGALLNGMAFEALNNVAHCDTKITIVLNDNKMAIGPRVGGMAEHLAKLSVSVPYRRLKQFVKDQCRASRKGQGVEDKLGRIKTKLKSLLLHTNLFEEMEISYWGPFDGHNTRELSEIFELSKEYPNPLLIHVVTQKGRGCAAAVENPSVFHGVGSGTVLDEQPKQDVAAAPVNKGLDWSGAVAAKLAELAAGDSRLVVCTAAMAEGAKLLSFAEKFPHRFFDVGIAEGHMLTYAAGLAAGGMRPVVSIYSTFLQRAMDQLIHDISMQSFPVLIAVDRAGLTGEDGETHQGLLDMAWGRAVPDLVVCSPRDLADLSFMLSNWLLRELPMLIRYPKGKAPERLCREAEAQVAPWGRAEVLKKGKEICLVGIGSTVPTVLEASRLYARRNLTEPTAVDLRFAAPIDWDLIDRQLEAHSLMIVAEDGYGCGGVGEAIGARAAAMGSACRVFSSAVPSRYIAHATRAEQLQDIGLTPEGIAEMAETFYGRKMDAAASG